MSTQKSLIRDLFPPIIYRFLVRAYFRAQGAGWSVFSGWYPTLADVPAAPGGLNNDWFVADAVNQSKSIKFEISRDLMGHEAGLLVLPLLVSQLLNRSGKIPTVLDFGGGTAKGLRSILEHVPNIDLTQLQYILVETPAMCRAVRGLLAMQARKLENVQVVEEIPSSLPPPLIVHASGTIQYVPDYHAALSRLLALAPEIFIIATTPVTDAPTFAQAQHNNPHRTVGRWVFNRDDLISEIEKSGYHLAFIFDQGLPVTYKNSRPSNDVSMVFQKLASLH
jgi:putative methyltransferase (TIGR04325 family)